MHPLRILCLTAFVTSLLLAPLAQTQQAANPPLPEIHQFILDVADHQKQLDKVRENYTFNAQRTIQDMDSNGEVKKTETEESEEFFVNGHVIGRTVKKNGQPLSEHELKKETERVTKLAEKAEKTPRDQPLEGQTIGIRRLLEIMDVRNPRRETYRGRPTIVFDFIGRKDASTHGIAEDASKKLQGAVWVDEANRQVVHLDATFNDNFHVAGGLLASIQKDSSFHFDQGLVNGEIWLPTGSEATVLARVLIKGIRQHITEHDFDYQRFHVETQQLKDTKIVPKKN